MGALRTSEEADVVAGEGAKDPKSDERPVDSGAKIIIGPGPLAKGSLRPRHATGKQGGLWLVVIVYILSAAALAYAIYERFVV